MSFLYQGDIQQGRQRTVIGISRRDLTLIAMLQAELWAALTTRWANSDQ